MSSLDEYLAAHADDFQRDLFELLRIESISAKSEHKADVGRAAQWLVDHFGKLGLKVERIETPGNPVVYAESPAVPGAPTVLVYGHYDVQPVEPLNLWTTPPFEPTVRGGNVFARGATDDKGQMLTHVKGADAWLRSVGRLPVRLKFLIEGEEEVGSKNLNPLLEANREKLQCDVAVVSDTSQFAAGQPAITYGLRGIACFEIRLTGPKQDLHSGTFGGALVNPAVALCQILSALRDSSGRVTIPGFYDDVVPLSADERRQFAALPFDEQQFQQQIGTTALAGEAGFSTLERRWARPTFDINGLTSGYQGEGAKTIIPARASAKISLRLVPRQDPHKIAIALERHLRTLCPSGIELELVDMHGAPAVVVPLDSPWVAAASRAIDRAFGKPPVFMREGGSIPVVAAFRELLAVDTLLLGWGLDDDNAHSPNEKFSLADFQRGIRASAYLWEELAKAGAKVTA
jgi:acetylornithine deacetylase/succinyl-diaminopimelate desuccinylase-like protein